MGEVMVARDQSINKVLDLMKKSGLNEESAMKKIINMGIRDYVAELYVGGEITVREAAEILQLNFRQTLEILEKKVGGNVGREEENKALDLARKLAEKS
jgi:predicted HTH domain antitoxin